MKKIQQKLRHLSGKAATPSADQLAAINRYAIEELAAADVYVRTMYLAHNAIDRDREVMDAALLDAFARTLPGKGLFVRHPTGFDGDSGPGEGRFFEARVQEMTIDAARALLNEPGLMWPPGETSARVLVASFYSIRTGENEALLAKIDAGVAGDVSIGFWASERSAILDANGTRIATRLQAPGEALEASLVWLGAQPGARIRKAAGDNGRDTSPTPSGNLENPLENPLFKTRPTDTREDLIGPRTGKTAADAGTSKQANPLENSLVTGKAAGKLATAEPDGWKVPWMNPLVSGRRA